VKASKPPTVSILARCIRCHRERLIGPGDVKAGDCPMCETCFLPLFPVKAVKK
jgi:hypothetical protein